MRPEISALSDRRGSGMPNSGITSSASNFVNLITFWSGTTKTRGNFVKKTWKTTTW